MASAIRSHSSLSRLAVLAMTGALAASACASEKDEPVPPDDDLSGDWYGCIDDDCSKLTVGGVRLTKDGHFQRIEGSECALYDACSPSISYIDAQGLKLRLRRCVVDEFDYRSTTWRWTGSEVEVDAAPGITDVVLTVQDRTLESPFYEARALYHFPEMEIPYTRWMVRAPGKVADCIKTR